MDISLNKIIAIAKTAGQAILPIYEREYDIVSKSDGSPLTEADRTANRIICDALKTSYPHIPILSEEHKAADYDERKGWEYLWIIDPLDGTKEFIKKNGEFTVNIALVHKGTPVLGVVHAPALGVTYYARKGAGAFKEEDGSLHRLPRECNADPKQHLTVVTSRSHLNEETETFIDTLRRSTEHLSTTAIGSSLKLCLVAEGHADCYPRLGPTMEWDTAAAHAIVLESGKRVYQYAPNRNEAQKNTLQYNKADLHNPWFIVR